MSETTRQTPPRLRFSVAPDPSRLLRARERIRDYLGLHCGDREVVNDIVLAVEEACTNAIRHSGSTEDIEIVLSCARDDLTVKIKDKGRGFDIDSFDPSRLPDPLLDHGRGLFLISRLCDEVRLGYDAGLEVELLKHAVTNAVTVAAQDPSGLADTVYGDSRHRSFLEEIDELFAALDWEFRYLYVNKRFCQITGRTPDELLGGTLWEVFPEVIGTDVEQRLNEAMHLGLPSRYEFYFPPLESWFEQRLYPTAYGINQFSIEINERKRKEASHSGLVAELRESEEGARVLAEVVEQANVPFAIREPDGRLVRFNRAFTELTGYSRTELEKGGSALAAGITPPDWWEIEKPLLAQAVAERRPARYEKEYVRKDGSRVPVEVFVQPVFDEAGTLAEYRSFLTDITERKRAEEALRESEQRFRSLFESMAEGVALHELVYADGRPVDYRLLDVNSSFERQTGLTAGEARGKLASELYGTGEAPYLADYARVAQGGEPYSFETYFAPMERHFRITAVSPRPSRFATVFEDITERKRSEQERERLLQNTALLLEAATAATSWTDLDQMLESICDLLLRSTDHSRVVLELWDEERREVEIAASRGPSAIRRERFSFDVLSKTAREAITSRTTLVLDSAASEMPAQRRRYADEHAFVLTLIVPIVHRERLIGLVTLDEPGDRRPFSPQEVELVEAIAGQAGAAVAHARLFEEQQRIATTLQANFIHPLPSVAELELGIVSQTAFEPELVGGDFSDVFVLADGRVAILIGDVAGKGVRAAGLTETVRAKVRALASIDSSPAFVLAKANELTLRLDPDDPHVTAFYCVLDPRTGHLSYASAGHPAPIHLGSSACAPLPVTYGPPLGAFLHDYATAHAVLTRDDCLVLYSDGVTEARRDGELFGERRLIETVCSRRGHSPQELAESVRDAAVGFAGQLKDDLQIVALRLG